MVNYFGLEAFNFFRCGVRECEENIYEDSRDEASDDEGE